MKSLIPPSLWERIKAAVTKKGPAAEKKPRAGSPERFKYDILQNVKKEDWWAVLGVEKAGLTEKMVLKKWQKVCTS